MKTTLRFQMTTYEEDGTLSNDIDHTTEMECEYLPEVLYAFKSFLQGAGFNYVDNVYVIKSDGEELGEE